MTLINNDNRTKYVLTFTNGNEKFEKVFNTVDEVTEFLNISKATYYKLCNGKYKYVQEKTQQYKNLSFKKINSNSKYHRKKHNPEELKKDNNDKTNKLQRLFCTKQ